MNRRSRQQGNRGFRYNRLWSWKSRPWSLFGPTPKRLTPNRDQTYRKGGERTRKGKRNLFIWFVLYCFFSRMKTSQKTLGDTAQITTHEIKQTTQKTAQETSGRIVGWKVGWKSSENHFPNERGFENIDTRNCWQSWNQYNLYWKKYRVFKKTGNCQAHRTG